ncbi:TPA: hypothetical protein ACX3EJ_001049 [Vibrio parahaemolyticus]
MTEVTLPDPTRHVHRFIKRLEKKGIITGKVNGANYRKVKILKHKKQNLMMIIMKTAYDREIQLQIDLLGLSLCPSAFLNNTFVDLQDAIKRFKEKSKEAQDATKCTNA